MNSRLSKFQQEQIEHRNAMYKKNRQLIRDLRVTPLRLPYGVQQEVCGELERALEYKPNGWDVYIQMYTERVPLKGIRAKFEVFGTDKKVTGTRCTSPITSICPRTLRTLSYKTPGLVSSGTQKAYTPGASPSLKRCT